MSARVAVIRARLQAVAGLFAPAANESHGENVGIQRQGPISNVINIVTQSFFEAGVAAPAVDLRVAGDAGAHRVANVVADVFFSEFAGEFGPFGPRSDQTHIAAQDIPELRKLIDTETTQIESEPRASRVAGNGPNRAEFALRLHMHRSEFDNRETAAFESHPNLAVEDRAAILQTHNDGDDGEQRR